MKKFSFFALAAAGLLFGACSSDRDVSVSDPLNPYGLVEGESSWIAVGIAMPGDPITRANEDLTDGNENEFKVNSGTLYLFKGENENAATFFASYPLNTTFSKETNDNVPGNNSLGNTADGFGEITSSSQKVVQEIENPKLGTNDKLYAYVILNDNGNETTITATKNSTTGQAFKKLQLQAIGIADETEGFGAINDKGLVMTSVPISTVAGGDSDPAGADIITFAEIDKSAIYKTKGEAEASTAKTTCIYVERAAVKVEVKLASGFGIQLDGEDAVTAIYANDVKWALGNVNWAGKVGDHEGVGYYNTRQFDTNWLSLHNNEAPAYLKYRMVGRTAFFPNNHTPNPAYRTYFAEDPNYIGSGSAIPYNANRGLRNAQLKDALYTLAPGAVTYTYENTFDENSQIYRNTTYVGVKVKINNGDFYTMEGQPNTKLADNDAIKAVVETRLRDKINQNIAAIKTEIEKDLAKSTGRTISNDVTKVTFDYTITVTEGTYNGETGELPYTLAASLTNVMTNDTTPSTEDASAINTLATGYIGTIANPENSKVYKYVGGIAYYAARIQHFGDTETPWGAPSEAYNVYQHATNPCVYPANGQQTYGDQTHNFGTTHKDAWLGRWGIVRNNWYELTLKNITGIGTPVPVDFNGEAGNTPDDNPDTSYFISAEVHILPWVKRTQSVNF